MLLDLYVGNYYGKKDPNDPNKQLMALIYQTASIYTSMLVPEDPIAKVRTEYMEFKPYSKRYEVNLNKLAKKINVPETIRELVLESLFKWGIAKVALGSSSFVRMDDDSYSDPGFPFAASINLDNWVHDMRASSIREARYMGDYYEVGSDVLESEKMFDKKVRDRLLNNIRKNEDVGARASDLSTNRSDYDLFCDHARLIDIWIPAERKVYTFDANLDYPPLNVVDYSGNSEGPYKFLSYDDVPGNSVPVSPLENLVDLAEVANSLMRRNVNRARGQKEVVAFVSGSAADAEKLRNAQDGEYVQISDAQGIVNMKGPGVDQQVYALNEGILDHFNRLNGNTSTMAGLGAQTKTVGQEELLNEQVGALMQKMQRRVVKFVTAIYGELGYHLWLDQVGMRTTVSLADFGLPDQELDRSWIPGERQGDIASYLIEIEPSSMVFQSSQSKLAQIDARMEKMLVLLQTPYGAESGVVIDIPEYVATSAELSNTPEMRRIFKITGGQTLPDPPKPENALKTKQNGGEYIHHGPGPQPSNPQQDVMKMMANASNDNAA
jgi:hypothetical protein